MEMKLARFAFLDAGDGKVRASQGRFTVGDVEVISWKDVGAGADLVSAEVSLPGLPSAEDGKVMVPEAARRKAERGLETVANVLTVTNGTPADVASTSLTVAFNPESDEEKEWLRAQSEVPAAAELVNEPILVIPVDTALVASLGDRLEGVALLAEALASNRLLGAFRDLFRLFELAFRNAPAPLVAPLADFLAKRRALGYTKAEVDEWKRVRHKASHADRRRFALEADVRPIYNRVLLAAYEVLLTKRTWHSPSIEREDRWTPPVGVLDARGRFPFVTQRRTPPFEGRLYDGFDAYPVNLAFGERFGIPEPYWPRAGPSKSRTRQFQMRVVAPKDLALQTP